MKTTAARIQLLFAALVIIVLLTALQSAAQMGGGRGQGRMMGGPFHNTGTEVTINGTVDEVQQITGTGGNGQTWSCPRGWTGTHLMLKTDAGMLPVHVGPSAYLATKNMGTPSQHDDLRSVVEESQVLYRSAVLL